MVSSQPMGLWPPNRSLQLIIESINESIKSEQMLLAANIVLDNEHDILISKNKIADFKILSRTLRLQLEA
jgi:hypothetical protein